MAFVVCQLIQNKWRTEKNFLGLSNLCPICGPRSIWLVHWDNGHFVHHVFLNVLFFCLMSHSCMCLLLNHLFLCFLSHFHCCVHVFSITAVRIHNHTVLTTHNSSSVYTNDSAYTNISTTVGEALTRSLTVHNYGSWGIASGFFTLM